jgi:hypothetical protein
VESYATKISKSYHVQICGPNTLQDPKSRARGKLERDPSRVPPRFLESPPRPRWVPFGYVGGEHVDFSFYFAAVMLTAGHESGQRGVDRLE